MQNKDYWKKYLSREFWESGASEVLGYLSVMPGIILFMAAIVSVIQLGTINTKMQYVAYVAARAAVTCEDYKTAKVFAQAAVKRNMDTLSVTAIDKDTIKTQLTITNGKVDKKGNPVAITSKKNSKNWKKGNYVNCTITADIASPLFGGSDGKIEKKASITMMIERPAEDDLSILWEGGA